MAVEQKSPHLKTRQENPVRVCPGWPATQSLYWRVFPSRNTGLFLEERKHFFFLERMQIQTDDSWNICHSNGFCHNWAKHSNARKHLSKIWQGFQIMLPFNPLLNKNVRSDRTLYLVNITSSSRLIFFGTSYSKVTWLNFRVIIIETTVEGFKKNKTQQTPVWQSNYINLLSLKQTVQL